MGPWLPPPPGLISFTGGRAACALPRRELRFFLRRRRPPSPAATTLLFYASIQPEFGMQGSDLPMTEREKLRQAFQIIGPLKLRFLLEHYPDEFPPNIFGDVVAWLRENEIDNAAAVERDRWSRILTWTTIVVVAVGVAGMLAAWTAAWPVAKGWIQLRGV